MSHVSSVFFLHYRVNYKFIHTYKRNNNSWNRYPLFRRFSDLCICSRCVNIYLYMQIYDVYVNLCEWTLKWIFNSRQYDALCVYERKRVCMYVYIRVSMWIREENTFVGMGSQTPLTFFVCIIFPITLILLYTNVYVR